jgi:hypothetical protein
VVVHLFPFAFNQPKDTAGSNRHCELALVRRVLAAFPACDIKHVSRFVEAVLMEFEPERRGMTEELFGVPWRCTERQTIQIVNEWRS